MPLSDDDIDRLVDLIAKEVSVGILLDLHDPYLDLQTEVWRKEHLGDADGGRRGLAKMVVEAFNSQHAVPHLASTLYRTLYRDPVVAAGLLPFISPRRTNAQAVLSSRSRLANARALEIFWAEASARVCAVVVENRRDGNKLGTGFLVAPDLVITAYHTLADFISGGKAIATPGEKYAVFDFYTGPQIPGPSARATERWVSFADDWLVESSPDLFWDGSVKDPDEGELGQLRAHLDFALIRLAEPVGLESVAKNGGRRRSWFTVPTAAPSLTRDQLLTMPQHQQGYPQEIAFGAFIESCPSMTRLRSKIETDNGASGAPCFLGEGSEFTLVGMHNASYRPGVPGMGAMEPPAVANQAIRVDHIATRIARHINGPPPSAEMPLWSTRRDVATPIIGRQRLIAWIGQASDDGARATAFAAVGAGRRIGKTFSIDILRAALRDTADRVVEIGGRGSTIPAAVPDLVRTIFDQLAMPLDRLQGMPARPARETTEAPDKLTRWASVEVPRWLLGEIADCRRTALSPLVSASHDEAGLPSGGELSAPASAEQRWNRVWLAVRLEEADLARSEIMDFLSALIRMPDDDMALAQGAPLRWLFVGALPDFAGNFIGPWREMLNPMDITADDVVATATAIAQSLGGDLSPQSQDLLRATVSAMLNLNNFKQPETRLADLQDVIRNLIPHIRALSR